MESSNEGAEVGKGNGRERPEVGRGRREIPQSRISAGRRGAVGEVGRRGGEAPGSVRRLRIDKARSELRRKKR